VNYSHFARSVEFDAGAHVKAGGVTCLYSESIPH
jgi:hypothetical protein